MNQKNHKQLPNLPRKAVVLAVSLAFAAPTWAEDDEVARLIKPESTISVGMGHVSGDNQRFGMYNGLNEAGYVGMIDFSIVRRADETGTWYRAFGRNLGLDNRELGVEIERAGKWGFLFNYDEVTRHAPYDVWTNNLGIGSAQQTIPGTSGTAGVLAGSNLYKLKTERQKVSFGFNVNLFSNLDFRLFLQNEQKEGQRLFGRGTPGTQEFLAEPIDSSIRQIDAVLDYTGESLQLSGGYYGSFYSNANSSMKVTGGAAAFNGGVGSTGVAFDNIGLPPDNYAHQLHLAGGYQFTKTTRMNFKMAKSVAGQDDEFMGVNFYGASNNGISANTSGRNDLGGRVDTTLLQLGVTSRPITNLTLLGNLRYEDRDDKTTVARYITNVTGSGTNPTFTSISPTANFTSSTDGFNEPRSLTNMSGKFEASYLLPAGIRLTGGYDIEQKERSMNGIRIVGYREKTLEDTFRLEAKRTMAETLSGTLTYLHSNRDGSGYKDLTTLNGTNNYPSYGTTPAGQQRPCGQTIPAAEFRVTRCGLIQPIYMADRERDKIRFLMDWSPTDQFSAQFAIEGANDNYDPGRGAPDIGIRKGEARVYSVDLSYALSDAVKLNGWYSRSTANIDQSTIAAAGANANAVLWSSSQRNSVDTVGVGIRAKLPMRFDMGADYLFAYDKTEYMLSREQFTAFTSSTTPGVLPDIKYRQATWRMFGTYSIDKDTKVRLDYVVDNRRIADWTWTGYQYSDGTRVAANLEDTVHFIGLSMNYAFR